MRDAAKIQLGYFPAPKEAIAHVCQFLRAPVGQPFTILDPCAGEGLAIEQLATTLGCKPENVHAIELDERRGKDLRERLPDGKILTPADIEGCRASKDAFSFIWLNPPFDYAYDGGRLEGKFLEQATKWLMPGGVLALVLPEKELDGYSVRYHLKRWFDCFMMVRFPENVRNFGEVVCLAVKREKENHNYYSRYDGQVTDEEKRTFEIPPYTSKRSPNFLKVNPTPEEMEKALRSSPLRLRWNSTSPVKAPSPPLALSLGHVALLLAAGHLDGVVKPGKKAPHVVRGTARKQERVASQETTENDDGSTTTKTIKVEEIQLIVRTVGPDGVVRTFTNAPPPPKEVPKNGKP